MLWQGFPTEIFINLEGGAKLIPDLATSEDSNSKQWNSMDAEVEDPQWWAVINQCCGSNRVLAPVLLTGKGQMLSTVPCSAIRPSACTPQVQEDCCKASHLLGSEVTYGALTSTPVQYKPAATPPAPPGRLSYPFLGRCKCRRRFEMC